MSQASSVGIYSDNLSKFNKSYSILMEDLKFYLIEINSEYFIVHPP